MNSKLLFSLLLILSFHLVGCQPTEMGPNQKRQIYADSKNERQIVDYHPFISEELEKTSRDVPGVDQAVSIVIGQDASIALRVTGFDRLRLKSIKSQVSEKVKKKLPKDYNIHITTDKKVYRDMQVLKIQIENGTESSKKLMKQFKKLNKDMHG